MSFRNPRLGLPLAFLSSFKLFLIARAIGGSGFGMSCRLIQPDAALESTMQRDMQWDVTCCTVTSPSLLRYSLLKAYSETCDRMKEKRERGPPDETNAAVGTE